MAGKFSALEESLYLKSLTMSRIETLGILDEIQALVSDHLQVVSYKWLSRNFLVSSNASKRLLDEFVEKHGSGLEVVYTLSGWSKSSPLSYNIRLVSGPKLEEAKQEFDGNCSVQVYSVQTSIPKDPAALWNAEFVQAEELFKQPSTLDNCLRDNRFCGISNSFVSRNVNEASVSIAAVQPKSAGIPQQSTSNSTGQNTTFPPPQQNKIQQSSPKVGLPSLNVVKDVKVEHNGAGGVHDEVTKPSDDKEKLIPLPASKKKGQNDKSSSGNGGLLANLWGHASVKSKSKSNSAASVDNNSVSNSTASADAQICAREEVENGSSDDDAEDVNFRRTSNGEGNRKRKVVFDLSDEEEFEDAVNLGSPDLPKSQLSLDPKGTKKLLVIEKTNLKLNELNEDKPKAKEEKEVNGESNQSRSENSAVVSKRMKPETSFAEKTENCAPQNDTNKDNVVNAVAISSKRKKVLKTRIDERGREVTEVIWEGEETETKGADSETTKKADNNPTKKADSNTVTDNGNRPPAAKKSPALGSSAPSNLGSKAGMKKGGNQKDPKQGNILSFFKRV